jgi:hypothetical protein
LDFFGKDGPVEETAGLTPAERRAEVEAQIKEDQLRRTRGELVDARLIEAMLTGAIIELRKDTATIAQDFARRHNLDRAARIALDAIITERVNGLAARLSDPAFHGKPGGAGHD